MNYNIHQDFSMCVALFSLRGFVKQWFVSYMECWTQLTLWF